MVIWCRWDLTDTTPEYRSHEHPLAPNLWRTCDLRPTVPKTSPLIILESILKKSAWTTLRLAFWSPRVTLNQILSLEPSCNWMILNACDLHKGFLSCLWAKCSAPETSSVNREEKKHGGNNLFFLKGIPRLACCWPWLANLNLHNGGQIKWIKKVHNWHGGIMLLFLQSRIEMSGIRI